MELFIALFAGAVGGNLAHGLLDRPGFGLAGNTVLGTLGGVAFFVGASQIFPSFATAIITSVGLLTLTSVLILGVSGGVITQLVISLIFQKSRRQD